MYNQAFKSVEKVEIREENTSIGEAWITITWKGAVSGDAGECMMCGGTGHWRLTEPSAGLLSRLL